MTEQTKPAGIPTWVRYLGVVAIVLLLASPLAWCMATLPK